MRGLLRLAAEAARVLTISAAAFLTLAAAVAAVCIWIFLSPSSHLRREDKAFVARLDDMLTAPGDTFALRTLVGEGWDEACVATQYLLQKDLETMAGRPVEDTYWLQVSGQYWGLILKSGDAVVIRRVPATFPNNSGGQCFDIDAAAVKYLRTENDQGRQYKHITFSQERAQ